MGKRAKGLDAVRQANSMKKQMLVSCKKYAEALEKENYELKNDPNTVIGAFIGQFRELYGQNQRLSTLGAALIKKLGDTVVMTREEMEQYKDKRINIKWEIADGETIETATAFTFSYDLQDAPPQGQPVQATEQPGVAIPADAFVVTEAAETQEAVTVNFVPDDESGLTEEEAEALAFLRSQDAEADAQAPVDEIPPSAEEP